MLKIYSDHAILLFYSNFVNIARQVASRGIRRCNLSRSIAKSRNRGSTFHACNLQCNFLLYCKLQTRDGCHTMQYALQLAMQPIALQAGRKKMHV